MVCEDKADVNIAIPAVMLPQDVGEILEDIMEKNSNGMALFLPKLLSH